ncbi:MAG: LysR family transcriptional regulator [Myxococcota bacterium]|nr:LysR family transcriptional regulator [Myxococcota bacterium]
MQLDRLRYFHAVARAGSITKAARALRVSQPSVSKTVRLLEEDEGVTLLDRTGRGGVQLTPAGRRFLVSCEVVFGEIEKLRRSVIAERTECVGHLKLGASDNVCNYLMPSLLEPFLARHPKVTVAVFSGTSDSIAKEILEGDDELGVFYTQPRDARLATQALCFVEFVVVAGGRAELTRRDLQRVPYVGSRTTDYVKRYPAMRMLASLGVQPNVVIETNNQETQKRLALAGLGYTVVPKFIVQREVTRGEAVVAKVSKRIGSPLFLVTRKGRTLSRPAELFAAHLRAMIPALAGGAAP